MTYEEKRAFDVLVGTYRKWRDARRVPAAAREAALRALSEVIHGLGWWKQAQDALIEKR